MLAVGRYAHPNSRGWKGIKYIVVPKILFDLFVCPSVTIEHGSGAIYKHPVIYNSTPILYIAASEGQEITGITHDGEDITDLVLQNDGKYAVKSPIKDNSIINITINKF